MAELVVFSLASKILSTIVSPAFNKAYEKGVTIKEARDELGKLQVSVETIQAVLLDAEKKQEGSTTVRNWIKRLKGVFYDAEDLLDQVATEDLIKQQMKKVHVFFSDFNPAVSGNSIANRVEAIRMSLDDISRDIAKFEFVSCLDERPMFNIGRGEDRGCFVDAKSIIGRDEEKKTMLQMLINESDNVNPIVLAIVGIGGMGKTTVAQLIYNDVEIEKNFKNRWFACISHTFDEREFLGKVFQSIRGEKYSEFDIGQLQTKIRESIKDKKYLLVLDDVWEDDRTRWQDRLDLLSSREIGSRIIVTTRLPSVAKAVGALTSNNLEGLSEDDSWSLFKRSAFSKEYENDPRREILGKRIMKKCSGVPLAIRSIGSLLHSKCTMAEWEAIEREDLPVLERKYNDKTMGVLKLSYEHLPSHLKHCFAYCCLFPKDYEFSQRDLITHWSAQGYIDPNDEESSFLHLLRMGFFQDAKEGDCGEIEYCKMHDLIHDLAIYVAGEESVVPSSTLSYMVSCVRHVSIEIPYNACDISTLELNAKLRSLLLTRTSPMYGIKSSNLGQLFASVKLLRTLSLSNLGIKNIPHSVGELKLMRHFDISYNDFEELPNSVANLVNLLSLNLESCASFRVWPLNFHKLTNLIYLNFGQCDQLRSMPMRIGEMTHLQYLSDFKAETGNECLNASARLLQHLRGKLLIKFLNDKDEGICSWQLPISLQWLGICGYRGLRIPGWTNNGSTIILTRLTLIRCKEVKYMPPLRCLPNLRRLDVCELLELECMEEGDFIDHNNQFFPCLEELQLYGLPKLKRCWGEFVEFPLLYRLEVLNCPKLEFNSLPLCPHVRILSWRLTSYQILTHGKLSSSAIPPSGNCKWLSSLASLKELYIDNCSTLDSLQLASPHLRKVQIWDCSMLMSIKVVVADHLHEIQIMDCSELMRIEVAGALTCFRIGYCPKLKNVRIAHPDALEELAIWYSISSYESIDWDSISNLGECSYIRQIFLKGGVGAAFLERLLSSSASSLTTISFDNVSYDNVNWDSFPNLHKLQLDPLPPMEKLPQCLVQRQARDQLQISEFNYE